jgi:hypothetical protein
VTVSDPLRLALTHSLHFTSLARPVCWAALRLGARRQLCQYGTGTASGRPLLARRRDAHQTLKASASARRGQDLQFSRFERGVFRKTLAERAGDSRGECVLPARLG